MMMAEEEEVEVVDLSDDNLDHLDEDTIVSWDTIDTASSSSSPSTSLSSSTTRVASITSNNSDNYYYYCPSIVKDDVNGDNEDEDKINDKDNSVTYQTSNSSSGGWTIVDYNKNLGSCDDDDSFDILFPDTPTVTLATVTAEAGGNFPRGSVTTTTAPVVVVTSSHKDDKVLNNENKLGDSDDEDDKHPENQIVHPHCNHRHNHDQCVDDSIDKHVCENLMVKTASKGGDISTASSEKRSKRDAKQVVVSSSSPRKTSCGCCFHFHKYGLWLDGSNNGSPTSIPFGNDSQQPSSSSSSSSSEASSSSCDSSSHAVCGGVLC